MANKSATKKAKKKSNKLDYSLVPEPEFTPTFMHLPKELEEAMRPCLRTLERMQAALSSARGMDSIKPEGDHSRSRAESAFRSALIDYVSIEDILKRELPAVQPPFKLFDTENPLPHILKQLRNLQVHLVASKMSERAISLHLRNVPGAEPVDVTVWTISDLTDSQLLELDAFKEGYYTPAQATEMVNWLNTRQTLFGIGDIIYRGVIEAAERITATYLK